jgi:hypothetical protein
MSDALVQRMKDRGERAQIHLGDGVYASTDGMHIWLRVHRWGEPIHEVALDVGVLERLDYYRERLRDFATTADMPENL